MAGTIQKFFRKSSALRIITSVKNPQSSNATAPVLFHQSDIDETKPNDPKSLNPFWRSANTDKTNLFQPPLQFYPSFSLGYFLNPGLRNKVNLLEEIEGVTEAGEDARTIWADSVKKKRKKKMNKHKLKKLRKRLRRKT